MSSHVRIYHPVTSEPFDVPEAKATELRLQEGWLSHPIEPDTAPAVQNVQRPDPKASRYFQKETSHPSKAPAVEPPEPSEED